jgi:hypothetical protein
MRPVSESPIPGPRAEYQRRLAERQARVDAGDRRALLMARIVAALLVIWMGMAWASCDRQALSRRWLLAPSALFVVALVARARALRARAVATRAARFYQRGLARIDGTWADSPSADDGDRFRDDGHPYAADLDLFGKGSVYALLSVARTPIGQTLLADWLKAPAPTATVLARQGALPELAARLDLREALAVAGVDIEQQVQEGSLLAWAETPARPIPRGARVTTFLLGLVGAAATFLLLSGQVPAGLGLLLPVALLSGPARRSVEGLDSGLAQRADELEVVSALLEVLEREQFQTPLAAELRRSLESAGVPASTLIRRFARLVSWYESRRNFFYAMLTAPLLLATQFALAISVWRARHGAAVAAWLRAVGAFEALASLATWHHEHPELPFPALVPDDDGPLLDGDDVGHPLIPAGRRVSNEVRLGRQQRLLLVSGSNMSGKSTYLRTVGVNVVLALAGATVCARRLRLSHLDLGATLRVNDSLQGGQSRFFAEITRIKQVVALAARSPLTLGLLDEILQGTNSHDRLLGAKGVVKTLLDSGALAIVTTHDLALARLADELAPLAANVHFEDRIQDGQLLFDYKMRDGVVTRTNALDLMRLVGLRVD